MGLRRNGRLVRGSLACGGRPKGHPRRRRCRGQRDPDGHGGHVVSARPFRRRGKRPSAALRVLAEQLAHEACDLQESAHRHARRLQRGARKEARRQGICPSSWARVGQLLPQGRARIRRSIGHRSQSAGLDTVAARCLFVGQVGQGAPRGVDQARISLRPWSFRQCHSAGGHHRMATGAMRLPSAVRAYRNRDRYPIQPGLQRFLRQGQEDVQRSVGLHSHYAVEESRISQEGGKAGRDF